MTDGRKRTTTIIASLGITVLGGSLLVASPSFAEPDIDDVQARVDKLYHEAEQASERYNDVGVQLSENRSRLKSLRADVSRQESKVETVRQQVAATVVSQYQGDALSSTTRVFLSEDPDKFLSQLATVSAYNDQQGQMMAQFATEAKQLEMREEATQREVSEIAEAEEKLADEKAEIDEKAAAAQDLLDELEAEERARLEAQREAEAREAAAQAREAAAQAREAAAQAPSRSEDRAPVTNVAASGRAGAAVDFALAQVGDSYVYGAAGPDSWDCSGLTMVAWQQAGVSLPHSSSGQMSSGPSVSQSDLQPGDLVFYYSPVSHVGMYIGNGQLVHAANPSSPVEIVPVNSMPYSGAVRPG